MDEDTLLNDDEKAEAKSKLGMKAVQNRKQLHTYKTKNPVLIKPAKEYVEIIENAYLSKKAATQPIIKSSKPVIINKSLPVAQPSAPSSPAAQKAKTNVSSPAMQKAEVFMQKVNSKKATKQGEVVNESKSSEPTKQLLTQEDIDKLNQTTDVNKLTKAQSVIRQKLAKKAAADKRQSIASDITDLGKINTKTETYNVNHNAFTNLMESYRHLSDDASIDVIPLEDRVKLKEVGVNLNTKLLSTLRTNL